jgi:hypothetical protein
MADRFDKMTSWRQIAHGSGGSKVVAAQPAEEFVVLYHYLPWEYAAGIMEHRRLRLSPVQSWQDPYEKWWCEQLFGSRDESPWSALPSATLVAARVPRFTAALAKSRLVLAAR